ncbi:MAG: DUF1566 domain-containing protein, partial [Gammaproteobacteria bacterium]|nr:DUF1566 domain-containing protein [Gammaproteobacteria bacterium]
QGLCGFNTGWRLPSREELRSIKNYSERVPQSDSQYFPNGVLSWTSNALAGDSTVAWRGITGVHSKLGQAQIRLVRGGQ